MRCACCACEGGACCEPGGGGGGGGGGWAPAVGPPAGPLPGPVPGYPACSEPPCGEPYTSCLTFCSSSAMLYVSSVSSNPVADILWSPDEPDGGGSGLFRHVWINAFPASLVIIGCSLRVANVYTCPVSLATSNITCVPVNVDNSYA